METIKYSESAKMNSGTIREIDIAVSKESLYNTGRLGDVRFYCSDSNIKRARAIAPEK